MYRLIFQPHKTNTRPPVTGDTAHLLIGRAADCGLRLTDAGVRDQHAAIERRDTGYFISDLTNSNGVRVNGLPAATQRLATGDEIEFGTVRLIFEVVRQPPPHRRAFDPWQLLGIVVIIGLVAGQLALFAWILAQPHPRNVRTDSIYRKLAEPALAPVHVDAPALIPLSPSVPPAAGAQEILSRMLKIIRVDRPDAVTLQLLIKAQVGDRQLDPKAVTVSVQCFRAAAQPGAVQWLVVPVTWENFKTKVIPAHLVEPCPGYIVRTYYRNQLQDVLAVPPAQLP